MIIIIYGVNGAGQHGAVFLHRGIHGDIWQDLHLVTQLVIQQIGLLFRRILWEGINNQMLFLY